MTTIAFVPREFVNLTIDALDALINNTPEPFQLVAVAAGYPKETVAQMRDRVEKVGGELIEFDHFVSPNQARNAALRKSTSDKIIFIDHDVFVEPNWLPPLLECAEQTGAALVMPLVFEGRPACKRIHMAGGEAGISIGDNGERVRYEKHQYAHKDIDTIDTPLQRQETGLVEFHCVLVDANWLKEIGGLDPKLLSTAEHWDLSIQAQQHGRGIFLEPAAKVTYTPPTKATPADLRWFNLRWNNSWNEASITHLSKKYDLLNNAKTFKRKRRFLRQHQRLRFIPLRKKMQRQYGNLLGTIIFHSYAKPRQVWTERPILKRDFQDWQEANSKGLI